MPSKPSPRPSLTQPLKRTDSAASELETAFLKQPFLEQRLERNKQPTARKCLRFAATGRTSVVHVDKLQIAEQTGVQLRDLRLLDPQLATSYPSAILARDAALVLNLEFVKAVVTRDHVLIMNPEEQKAINFVETLSRRLCGKGAADGEAGDEVKPVRGARTEEEPTAIAGNSPFELRALEVALDMVCRHLAEQTADLEAAAHPALDALTRKVTTHTLERVRRVKTRLVRLKTRVETLKELLAKLLDDDADMMDLNLSAKAAEADARTSALQRLSMDAARVDGASSSPRGHQHQQQQQQQQQPSSPNAGREAELEEEARARAQEALDFVEQLLEAYFMQVTSTENKLATLYEYVDDTEDYIDIEQDNHRNQLIRLDLLATAAMISLSIITVVTGWYAMNLNNKYELSYPAFYTVIAISVGLCVVTYLAFLWYCWYKKLMFR